MKRSKFSLSHTRLLAADMGNLLPIGLLEVLPGDTVQMSTACLLRCSPLLAPVMHPVTVRIHHWYVPNRLVWDNWEPFITGGPDGLNASVFPTMTNPVTIGTLGDYYGLPINNNVTYSALPMRGYNLIWNEHYRDQDLQSLSPVVTTDGLDTQTSRNLLNVAWEKDYFTSARPWEQKGPTITVPLGTSAPVKTSATPTVSGAQSGMTIQVASTGASPAPNLALGTGGAGTPALAAISTLAATAAGTGLYPSNLYADLQNASAITVNALRQSLALQRFEEARARYGSRYTEYLRYLGVRSSDARLQRPEYLGGGKQTVQFSEVVQTGPGDATDPVGDMHGHGIAAMRSNRYRRFIEEHGYIHSFISIRPKTMYMQGLARTWNKRAKEDFWQRELQYIGQQKVLNKEVYYAAASPDGTFGYQDRYDEYRRMESGVAGEFRTLLNMWHLAREFASEPALNAAFVNCTPTERVFADNVEKTLYIMASHQIQARRLVAKVGVSKTF